MGKVYYIPTKKGEIMQQPLFLNPNLRIEPGAHFMKIWFKAGFRKVGDLFYEVIPGLLPLQTFADKLEKWGDKRPLRAVEVDLSKILGVIAHEW